MKEGVHFIIVPFVKISFLLPFPLKALFIMEKNHAASETIQKCVVIPKKPKSFTTACVTYCMEMCNKQDMSQSKKPTSTNMLSGVYSVKRTFLTIQFHLILSSYYKHVQSKRKWLIYTFYVCKYVLPILPPECFSNVCRLCNFQSF